MLRGAQPVVVQLRGPGWLLVPNMPPPRRVPAQGPTEEVPWAWGHLHTQLHTSTWAWMRPMSCSNSSRFCLSLCMLARSFPQSRAWTRVAWGGRRRYYQPFLQLLPHCRGVAGHRVSVWEASTQPDSLPRALRGLEQAAGPDHRSLPSVREEGSQERLGAGVSLAVATSTGVLLPRAWSHLTLVPLQGTEVG